GDARRHRPQGLGEPSMKRIAIGLALALCLAVPGFGVCISQVWDGSRPTTGSRGSHAAVTTLATGECVVMDTRGFRLLTIETRPDSAIGTLTFTGQPV